MVSIPKDWFGAVIIWYIGINGHRQETSGTKPPAPNLSFKCPMLHFDNHVEVLRVDCQKLSNDGLGESSEAIRERVELSRRKQRERFANIKSANILANADMRVAEVSQFCKLDEAGESLIRAAMGQMNLSARGYHRVLKLARTIADLAGSEQSRWCIWRRPCSIVPKFSCREWRMDTLFREMHRCTMDR
jgi:Magnesium chelatase, subunit ChlI C-terminal